ncbi:hypothetical protein EJB05_56816, partial [Eragrostis curvula]
MFRRTIFSERWEVYRTVDFADLSPTESCRPDLFPVIWDGEEKRLALDRVLNKTPALDMRNDDVFYVTSMVDPWDPNAWAAVLAVDAGRNRLEKVAPFSNDKPHRISTLPAMRLFQVPQQVG